MNTSLTSFLDISSIFLDASLIELEGNALNSTMQEEVKYAAGKISTIMSAASKKTQEATIAADIHTDPNTMLALEETLGKFNVLIVIYSDANGELYSVAGPVYNYFEFTQPVDQRLTDEQWVAMLASNPPTPPEWTNMFAK
jgi:hypothetical protein